MSKVGVVVSQWVAARVTRSFRSVFENPSKLVKYDTRTSISLSVWSWTQYILTVIMMLHMFTVVGDVDPLMGYMYALFLFIQIFSLTSLLDGRWYSIAAEVLKIGTAAFLLYSQQYSWYGINGVLVNLFLVYLAGSFIISYSFLNQTLKRIKTESYGV